MRIDPKVRLSHAAKIILLAAILHSVPQAASQTPQGGSPFSFIRSPIIRDSLDIQHNMMMERYRSLNIGRSEEVLTYSGSTLWNYMTDIEVNGTTMYALDMCGVRVFDITDITSPALVTERYIEFGTTVNTLCLDGDYLYIGRSHRLNIFDVSDPSVPELVSIVHLDGAIQQIQVVDNRAYVGIARYGNDYSETPALYILNISNPTSPIILGKYESPSANRQDARRFAIVGSYIYSINNWDDLVEVISTEDESRPEQVAHLDVDSPLGIAYRDGYLYVAGNDLYVIDVSVPEAPTLIHTYDTPYSSGLAIHNDDLFLMVWYDRLIHAYEFTGAWELDSVGTYWAKGTDYEMTFRDSLMFVPENRWGFSIADISDPSYMPRIADYSHETSYMEGIDVSNDVAYATNYLDFSEGDTIMHRNGLFVVDVSDKENPEFILRISTGGMPSDVLVHDSLLIVSQCPRVNIYSLSDPLAPSFLSDFHDEYKFTHSSEACGPFMYVCADDKGFVIADIADPANPVPLAAVKGEGDRRYSIASVLTQNIAYVFDRHTEGAGEALMLIVDITDAQNPVIFDDFLIKSNDFQCEAIARGDYLYAAAGEYGLITIDISNPTQPDVVSEQAPMSVHYFSPCFKRNYLFVSSVCAFEVYSLSDPANPALVQFVPLNTVPFDVKVAGDYLYTSCIGGMHIFKINLPPVQCGDANASGAVDIDDVVFLISYIFAGGLAPDPYESGDADCSGAIDIDDVVWLIAYIFSGGNTPCDADGDGVPDC